MLQLRTVLKLADNTGIKKLRLFMIHGGSRRKFAYVGDIIDASAIEVDPQSDYKKGDKVKAVVVRTRKEIRRSDGSYIRFDDNAAVVIDSMKDKNPKGTRVFGPIAREVKEAGFAKIASLAPEVL